jgi:hypothetical protein
MLGKTGDMPRVGAKSRRGVYAGDYLHSLERALIRLLKVQGNR